jgi:hypothetical protein
VGTATKAVLDQAQLQSKSLCRLKRQQAAAAAPRQGLQAYSAHTVKPAQVLGAGQTVVVTYAAVCALIGVCVVSVPVSVCMRLTGLLLTPGRACAAAVRVLCCSWCVAVVLIGTCTIDLAWDWHCWFGCVACVRVRLPGMRPTWGCFCL